MLFCPTCANLLVISSETGYNKWACNTCAYEFPISKQITSRTRMKQKAVDDVLGGEEMWKHADATDATCDKCNHRRAYFYQLQIRSADEPMTTCVLAVGTNGVKTSSSRSTYPTTDEREKGMRCTSSMLSTPPSPLLELDFHLMSDQSPPPKPKPGSLRDRIAAFENKSASGAPPTRPKPGGVQWKPRAPSPPTSPDHVQSGERKPPSTGGMSATDAMESIGRGGSLKERMAALQGKGAFGGPPPPIAPKPNVERPKWKPPPTVPVPVSTEDEPKEGIAGVDASGREASRSPPPRAVASPIPEDQGASNHDGNAVAQEGDGDLDPEEEERQRRAAIAARMARLGGARFGLGPPIFAPKPVVRKPESVPTAPEEQHGDQPTVVKESNEALVTSPSRDLPAAVSPAPEADTEIERRDEPESPPPVPTRTPASMPVPAGPRRAAPPRKKAVKSAPATALPEPPVEEVESVTVQSPPITNETPEIGEPADAVEATYDDRLYTTINTEQRQTPLPAPTETFHGPAEEPAKQEAEEELVESADVCVEGSAIDEQEVSSEQPPEAVEAEEEEEEARRQRVAAKLTQMGAFNPLVGHPPIPQRQSLDEPAFATTEDKVHVDTEEYGGTILSPLAVPPRHDVAQSVNQDDAKVEEDDRVPAHRDGERAVTSYAEDQGDRHDRHVLPCLESPEDHQIEHDSVRIVARQTQGTTSSRETTSGTAALGVDEYEGGSQGVVNDQLARSTIAETEHDTSKDEAEANEMSPPRIMRRIPPPPPVNLWSKPTPPSSPPLSPPPKVPLQALRVDEEECPPSPDIPPRPVPPPSRRGTMEDLPLSPPRRSMPPPPRRTSVRATEPLVEPPSSPPLVPTSPRMVNRRPDTPPIITRLPAQEQEHVAEEETSETVTPQPDVLEDDESARRRAIAERMARLGAIRFGAPPAMNPLSRPPLPSAPPPTSIPPDEIEEEAKEEGPREEEEEEEAARKQRIAAKLAGMGGMRLGMLPPTAGLPPASSRQPVAKQDDSENEDAMPPVPIPAPPQRPPPTRKPPPPVESPIEREPEDDVVQIEAELSEMEEVRYSDAEAPLASEEEDAPALPPRRSTQTADTAEALPTPPPRMTSRSPPPVRPPIPTIPALLGRRSSATVGLVSASSSRQASLDESSPGGTPTASGRASESALRSPSEYVMVEAEDPDEDDSPAPLPRRKSTRGSARTIPSLPPVPPPSAIDPPESLTSSAQWELPSIPQGVEFGEGSEMTSSVWSEDSTAVHVPPPALPGLRSASSKVAGPPSSASGSGTVGSGSGSGSGPVQRSLDQQIQLTTDELMAIWGKTGVRVVETATTLFEKSKRALVGDGSYAGFVRAVLAQVPGAVYPSGTAAATTSLEDNDWGYVVYAQMGNAVQRRVSDILPGDVIAFWDAKLKGHKGLHAYTQIVGTTTTTTVTGESSSGGPLVGIVSEFDTKKSKVRVWQANQHVGQQTVEIVSYRLEDLKSGQVKVYRVLDTHSIRY